jgi:hypothetical protein
VSSVIDTMALSGFLSEESPLRIIAVGHDSSVVP